jgi:hypothetical protein
MKAVGVSPEKVQAVRAKGVFAHARGVDSNERLQDRRSVCGADEGTRVPELDYRSTGKDQSFQTG